MRSMTSKATTSLWRCMAVSAILLLSTHGLAAEIYRDPKAAIDHRVEDLLARMTLEEKTAQLVSIWQSKNLMQDDQGQFSSARAKTNFPHGIGQIARPSDRVGSTVNAQPIAAGASAGVRNREALEAAAYANAAQRWALEETRLGIPLLMHEEALHGFVARGATSFPQAIALASSWDPQLVESVMAVAAREMRLRGANFALAPVVDIVRDPRWGRSEECFGEDPYLTAKIGLAAVHGLQGRNLPLAKDKVFATLKHLTGHGQPENGINVGPAQISERFLRENFLFPFEHIIRNAPVRSVMASYNEIDGIPSHANRWLLEDVLRKEWSYQGLVVSDYFGIRELGTVHQMSASLSDAAARALMAGVDVELPDAEAFKHLPSLLSTGAITQARLDDAVRRVLKVKFEAGLFEDPYVDPERAQAQTATADAIALARTAASRSLVLLKNEENLLPLPINREGKLLVIGTHARDTPIGGYSDVPKHVVSVLEGIQSAGSRYQVEYAEGVRLTASRVWEQDQVDLISAEENAPLIAEALAKAKQSDLVVLVLGENEQLSREAWAAKHLGDRASLDLVGQQNELASAIFALRKPTVVLLLNGRALDIKHLAEGADALIEGWYLGQETGNGFADVLFGKVSPGGKLPISFARSAGHLPVYYSKKPSARRGYLFDDVSALFPFGFGLSYGQFTLSDVRLSHARIGASDTVELSAKVTNASNRSSDEVVQVYLRDSHASVTRPVLQLVRFERLFVPAKSSKTLRFTLTPADFSLWNQDMKFVLEPGSFELKVGFDSVNLQTVALDIE
jgi:beta-glucosidase